MKHKKISQKGIILSHERERSKEICINEKSTCLSAAQRGRFSEKN
jgi:hypothetical protein